jgi:AhpD family alkylhydroperoxidase
MNARFEPLTPDTATRRAADLLADIVDRNGSAGQMVRTMAHSPAVLQGYLELSRAMKRSRLDRAVSERISLAVQAELGCELCLAAHTEAALAAGVERFEVELAKQGTSSVVDIAALVAFARQVHTAPATVSADDLDTLRRLGYRDRDLLDVVGLVALNVLTGTFNLVAGLEPLDQPAAA